MMFPGTTAAARSATRTLVFRRASSSSSTSAASAAQTAKTTAGEAAQKAKSVLEDAENKAKVLSEKIAKELPDVVNTLATNSQKMLDSPAAQKAKWAVHSATAGLHKKYGGYLGKAELVLSKAWYGMKVTYFIAREVAVRERFGPPRLSEYPAAKAEFLSMVDRVRPYVREPSRISAAVKAELKEIAARRKYTVQKTPEGYEVYSRKGGLTPNLASLLRSTVIAIEILTFFLVGEMIGKGSVIGYNVPDNRPKKEEH